MTGTQDVFFQEGHSCGVQQEHLDAKHLGLNNNVHRYVHIFIIIH
jgi:hypothetical protein